MPVGAVIALFVDISVLVIGLSQNGVSVCTVYQFALQIPVCDGIY